MGRQMRTRVSQSREMKAVDQGSRIESIRAACAPHSRPSSRRCVCSARNPCRVWRLGHRTTNRQRRPLLQLGAGSRDQSINRSKHGYASSTRRVNSFTIHNIRPSIHRPQAAPKPRVSLLIIAVLAAPFACRVVGGVEKPVEGAPSFFLAWPPTLKPISRHSRHSRWARAITTSRRDPTSSRSVSRILGILQLTEDEAKRVRGGLTSAARFVGVGGSRALLKRGHAASSRLLVLGSVVTSLSVEI